MSGTIRVAIRTPVRPADLPGLTARVCRRLERARPDVLQCELEPPGQVVADAVALDALARLALAARRHGCELRLLGVSPELQALAELAGLTGVLIADA